MPARLLVSCVLLSLCACSGPPPSDAPPDLTNGAPPDLSTQPPVDAATGRIAPTCQPPARGTGPSVTLENAYPLLPAFASPVDLLRTPTPDGRAFVVNYTGTVVAFPDQPDAAATSMFLDLEDRLDPYFFEKGLWDLAFHPQFPATPEVYVFYTGSGGSTGFRSVLSRLRSTDGGATIDPSTEEILLSLERDPGSIHAGGQMHFGADGYLYLSVGDGGAYGDPLHRAQDPTLLFGKLLRLDVSGGAGQPYAIPPDNPFVGTTTAPEIYAIGFRNPWRWSFDRPTGDLWLSDVGHEAYEEIDQVQAGGNYGWSFKEASHCRATSDPADCANPAFIDPVYEYDHHHGICAIGGYVYHGARIPELAGQYVFGDYGTGYLSALANGQARTILQSGVGISAFAEDGDGELLALDVYHGRALRLSPSEEPPPGKAAFFLSASGCLNDPGLIPYEVNTPLWSDGLDKTRQLAVPPDREITVDADGHWVLPPGSVVVKTFSSQGLPVETRMLARDENGQWSGYSYEWYGAAENATLVETGHTSTLPNGQSWYFPGPSECPRCHTDAARFTLGLETRQLDRGDQLARLSALFGAHPAAAQPFPAPDDATAPLAARARAYLHANCAMCHRPDGPTQGDVDLRADTPLSATHTCDVEPHTGDLGLANARLIAPGDPSRSVLLARMRNLGDDRMPPLATHVVDAAGTALIEQWIAGLSSCDGN